MWQHLKIFVIQLAAMSAVRMFDMGLMWIDGEVGLHPVLGGALALALLAAPHVFVNTEDREF